MNGTIRIGGKDYDYEVLYLDIPKFWRVFNNTYMMCMKDFKKRNGFDYEDGKEGHQIILPNKLYFWIIWKCLVKKRFWPLRKPFRSQRQMTKRIRSNEFQEMVDLAGRDILKLKWYEEGRQPGNLKKPQFEDTSKQ